MSIHDEIQDLIPAYALDAVNDADRALVERHLPQCDVCNGVFASYRQVADWLPYAVPLVDPPADLKYRVLAAALPKVQARSERAPGLIDSLLAGLSNLFRAPAFSALALLLIVALGLWNLSMQNQIAQQVTANQQVLAEVTRQRALVSTIAYADSQPKQMQATDAAPKAVGRLYAAPELNAFALIIYDMPTLPQGKVYQFWLIDPNGDRTSGGTFTVDSQGRGWQLIRAPKSLDKYQGVGITIEPEGGSLAPTGSKMMGTSL
jgi:anti-sigma-K factor RskA